MAKDDYFVIVYQILAYLYQRLKDGEKIDPEMLKHNGTLFQINEKYWQYIMENMLTQGYIQGFKVTKTWGEDTIFSDLRRLEITPIGIEYLIENAIMKKVLKVLKDLKEITPFL